MATTESTANDTSGTENTPASSTTPTAPKVTKTESVITTAEGIKENVITTTTVEITPLVEAIAPKPKQVKRLIGFVGEGATQQKVYEFMDSTTGTL